MSWKIKFHEETNAPIISDDGKITYIDPEGKELPLNPPEMYGKIISLGKENQKHREKYEALANQIKIFEGIDDLPKWKEDAQKALDTVANFNDKDWMKAEKVEQLKREMSSAYEDKLKQKDVIFQEKEKAYQEDKNKLSGQIRQLLVSNQFAVSKHFSGGGDKSVTILPSNIAEDHFGKYFKVEEQNGTPTIKAYYSNGDPVLSKVNPGEPANFEEAIGLIIDQYPGKESILRSTSGGSGGKGGSGDDANNLDDLGKLRQQLAKAVEEGNAQMSISLKNRISELQRRNAA
jgi:hypothetical protein